jgi:protoporphyrinogen oxidase
MKSKGVQPPVIIIGAGPTGLGAAYALEQSSFNPWAIYERDGAVGGLSKSIMDEQGFTWDIGGHVAFSHYGVFTRLLEDLLGVGWLDHDRESWIRVLRRWVAYPFQNNLRHLPPEQCAECLAGLIAAAMDPPRRRCANFGELIDRTFGKGIAELFMRPYNFKVWAHQPEDLDVGWIGERVAVPDPTLAARNIVLQIDDVSWGPNNRFRFPAAGGTGAIWRTLADRLPVEKLHLKCEVVGVDVASKTVRLADGQEVAYGTLVSTMPLDCLANLIGREEWIDLAAGLKHSAVHVVGVALRGKPPADLATKCWMYFPEDNAPFYRVTHFSHYSPSNVPDIRTHWSLMAEVSESAQKPVDAAAVADETVAGLVATGLITGPQQVDHLFTHRVEYGYPTPALGRDKIIYRLLPELVRAGIYSRGRFGAWRYEVGNMDHSLMQGAELARHLLHGSGEWTVWEPDLVNRPHPVLGWDRLG